MPRPKPNKLHDELDALLDGRPVELTDELAPLVEAADALRGELAAYQLDPEVADRHLERVLHGSAAVVQLPARAQANGWDLRRRVAAVVLAAALVLAPATMASAAALPGQAMYPFKRAIEQLRIASVQWSLPREAGERTRVADERLEEVQRLVQLRMFTQLPTALGALEQAVRDAQAAVAEAGQEGQPVPSVAAKLARLKSAGGRVLASVAATVADPSRLPEGTRNAITAAVEESRDVLPPPGPDTVPTEAIPTPGQPPSTRPEPGPDPTTAPPQPSGSTPPASPTTHEPPTTTEPPATTAPPTTEPPPEDTATPESAGGQGADGRSQGEAVPPTTIPAP